MSQGNPLWGAPRILSKLQLLAYKVSEQTVAKYMVLSKTSPSQTWKTFLKNHATDIAYRRLDDVPSLNSDGVAMCAKDSPA